MLSRIARKQSIALNLIGSLHDNKQATYDITEFMYLENKKYILTNNATEFKNQCLHQHFTQNTDNIILNTMDVAYYDKLAYIHQCATNTNRKLWNMLIFPTPRDNKNRVYMCNGLFIAEYYLSDKYDDKKRFVKFLLNN